MRWRSHERSAPGLPQRRGQDGDAGGSGDVPSSAALDVDYVAVADLNGHPTLAIAARAGRTRLIDNIRLDDARRAASSVTGVSA